MNIEQKEVEGSIR